MTVKFCTPTARNIRKPGAAPKVASLYSRFFHHSMWSVSEIMVTGMHSGTGAKLKGEDTARLHHMRTLTNLIGLNSRITSAGIILVGPAAVDIVPASSRIHRH
jgi:hypothetical protein